MRFHKQQMEELFRPCVSVVFFFLYEKIHTQHYLEVNSTCFFTLEGHLCFYHFWSFFFTEWNECYVLFAFFYIVKKKTNTYYLRSIFEFCFIFNSNYVLLQLLLRLSIKSSNIVRCHSYSMHVVLFMYLLYVILS